MAISYKKLWKLLIDRDMKKKDLMAISGVSQSSVTKMGKNENVNTDVLVRICLALQSSTIIDDYRQKCGAFKICGQEKSQFYDIIEEKCESGEVIGASAHPRI